MNTNTNTSAVNSSAVNSSAVTDAVKSTSEIQSVFQTREKLKFKFDNGYTAKIGKNTDIGGGRINQDDMCIIHFSSNTLHKSGCAICVADGHGELGEYASNIGVTYLKNTIKDKTDELITSPITFLDLTFKSIHEEIRTGLVEKLTKEKYEVEVNKTTGEIMKRRLPTQPFASLKCGTTFSVIVLLDKKLYIANVGDSTGMLYAGKPILKPSHITHELNSSISATPTAKSCLDDVTKYIELTGDHSPENPQEYIRMRNFKCSEENPSFAELMCVYNTDMPKHMCPYVFDISAEGVPTVRPEDGSFEFHYKTVRKEKATYVTDKYGDNALSVTRALGDFALNYRGVSCEPEIRSVDLEPIFNQLKENIDLNANPATASGGGPDHESAINATLCVTLCTDGVWDNWLYDHVGMFVFDKTCLDAIAKDTERGAERITNSFMLRNQTLAKKNFGWNSDNATGIIMYITDE